MTIGLCRSLTYKRAVQAPLLIQLSLSHHGLSPRERGYGRPNLRYTELYLDIHTHSTYPPFLRAFVAPPSLIPTHPLCRTMDYRPLITFPTSCEPRGSCACLDTNTIIPKCEYEDPVFPPSIYAPSVDIKPDISYHPCTIEEQLPRFRTSPFSDISYEADPLAEDLPDITLHEEQPRFTVSCASARVAALDSPHLSPSRAAIALLYSSRRMARLAGCTGRLRTSPRFANGQRSVRHSSRSDAICSFYPLGGRGRRIPRQISRRGYRY